MYKNVSLKRKPNLVAEACYFLEDALRYRAEKGMKYKDIDSFLDLDLEDKAENKLAVAFGSTPNFGVQEKSAGADIIRNSLIKRSTLVYASVAKGTDSKKIISVANDRKIGKNLDRLVKEINDADNYEGQKFDEIVEAYKGNISGTFFVESNAKNGRVLPKSMLVKVNNLLLDRTSDPNRMQDSKFVGYDGIFKRVTQLDKITGRMFGEELAQLKKQFESEHTNSFASRLGKPIEELGKEELMAMYKELDTNVVEIAKLHFYSEEDDCVYIATIAKKQGIVLNMSKHLTVTMYGKEVRFNAYFNTVYKTQKHYSDSALLQNKPFNEKEAELFLNLIEIIEKNATNPIIVSADLYKKVSQGIINKEQVINGGQPVEGGGLDISQIPLPSLSNALAATPVLTKYFDGLQAESSETLIGNSEAKLKSVNDKNISSRVAIVKVLSQSSRRSEEERIFIILKLVKEYGDKELYVRTLSVLGEMTRKVLKTDLLGGESLSQLSIEIEGTDSFSEDKKLLAKRELISILAQRPGINPENLTDKILDLYPDVIGGDDKILLKSKYDSLPVGSALNDLKLVIMGKDITPSTMVSMAYVNTCVDIVGKLRDVFANTDGTLTEAGESMIDFIKKVKSIYDENKETNSSLFQEAETKDIEADSADTVRRQQAMTGEGAGGNDAQAKSAFAVQSGMGTNTAPGSSEI